MSSVACPDSAARSPTKNTTLIPTHQTQELLLKVITILGTGALLCIAARYWDFSIKSNPPEEPPPQPSRRLPRRTSSSVEASREDLTTEPPGESKDSRLPSYAPSPEPSQAAPHPHPHPHSLGLGVRDVM